MENEKELVICLADAEQELRAAMNAIMQKNNLPCFLLEPIVDKLHRQLIDQKAVELAQAQQRQAAKEENNADDKS